MSIQAAETSFSIDLARRTFRTARNGYDPADVNEVLDSVAEDVARIVQEAEHATAKSVAIGLELDLLRAEFEEKSAGADDAVARADALGEELEELRRRVPADPIDGLADQIAAILRAAQETTADAVAAAEQRAGDIRATAAAEAEQLRKDTERLVESMMEEADQALRVAREETQRMVAEAQARVDALAEVEGDLRKGLDAAATWLGRAAHEPLAALHPAPPMLTVVED